MDPLLEAVERGVRVYDLGRPYQVGMPQSPYHPRYWHSLARRHGDRVRSDGTSSANDVIMLGTHVGTHVDALGHFSDDGRMHGGVTVANEQSDGKLATLGIDKMQPIVGRGLLLDVPRALGLTACEAGYEITAHDLQRTIDRQGCQPRPGDVVLIRSGWGGKWGDGQTVYAGLESGVPGPGQEAAEYLAGLQPKAVGADTIAFEHLPAGQGHSSLPAHRVFLVEHGIYIIETLSLEELAADQVVEFTFLMSPLNLEGATGAPARPLALIGGSGREQV